MNYLKKIFKEIKNFLGPKKHKTKVRKIPYAKTKKRMSIDI